MICRTTLFTPQRALRLSLSVLALSLPLAAPAQNPPGQSRGNGAPISSGAPATSAGSAGQSAPGSGSAPVAAPVSSSAVVKLKKEIQGGDFGYRFVSANGETALTELKPLPVATGTDVLVGVPSNLDIKTAKLEVLDNTRGNLARLPIKTDASIPLTEGSFTYAQRINVPVQKGGLGVIGAQVTLADAAKTYNKTTTLQASDGGLARFDNVPLGKELTATVSYADHKMGVTQTLLPTRTGDGWAPMAVDWADAKTVPAPVPVAVAATPNTPARGDSADNSSRRDRSDVQNNAGPFSGVLSTIVSLVFLGGIFYGVYWLYQTGRLKNVMDKLGLSSAMMATEAGTAAPSPFDKPAKPPIQPITDGTVDPFGGIGIAGGGMGAAPAPVVSGPRLVATMGTYAGSIFPLLGPSMDIGRDAGNPIPLPNDTNTSRRHATVQMTNGQVVLVDNGSSNGTYVNGVRIASQAPQPLRSGDEVNIGNTRFRFEA
jgi:hypothetical protein